MRTFLRSKALLVLTFGLLLAIPAIALADIVVADGDFVTTGNQAGTKANPIDVGTVKAGGSVTRQVSFQLVCNGSGKHVDQGQTITLDSTPGTSGVPSGGSLTATAATIGPIPVSWPDDSGANQDCATTPQTLEDNGNTTVTFNAPSNAADGTVYNFDVVWSGSDVILTPDGNSDSNAITGSTQVFFRVTVDAQAPDTVIDLGPTGTVNSNSATFTYHSTEANSTFETRLDNGAWVSNGTATSKTYSSLTDAPHSFDVRATDAAGNTDPSPATRNWTVQTVQATQLSAVSGNGTYGGNATLTAKLASGATNLSGKNVDFTLNGDSVGTAVTDTNGVAQLSGVDLTGINAGTHTGAVGASFAAGGGYSGSNATGDLNVAKATSDVEVTCPTTSVTYTGSALTPCSAKVTGAGGLDQNLTPSYQNNIGAGTATANASYTGDANHTGDSDSANFTIDKASSTTTVTCPASVPYTGSALTPCSVSVTGAGGLNLSPTPTYSNNVDAGTATASYTYTGDANHTGSNDSKNFNITFNFTGFSSPVDNLDQYGNPVLNSAKAGQAIPLKWRLTDASGNPVTNLLLTDVKVSVVNYTCGLSTTADLIEEYTGSSGLQNLGNGYYQYNWKTPTNYANSCKTMTLDLGEGTLTKPHTAVFKFTK